MTGIQPELWVENAPEAIAFYRAAFGATVLHLVGDGDDIVAQLGVGDSAFWVAPASSAMKRLSPHAIDGATSRTLLVVDCLGAQAASAGERAEAAPALPDGGGCAPRSLPQREVPHGAVMEQDSQPAGACALKA